ncbi:hypothetical protein AB1Y20_006227 [Prymnesium parvum]|uniref:N-acetyltransferase domain-containing protein n=1 Tax=Prymnesium parvum TaxID=97485 RepID=A0AB34J1N6_PRYPA
MYMYTLDLAFAALFAVCSDWITLGGAESFHVLLFFVLFLPLARLWDHCNALFNRFDVEDLVSELVVVLLMLGAMVMAFNTRECFFHDLLGGAADTPRACRVYSAAFVCTRLVLSVFTGYIARHVAAARPRVWRELALLLAMLPACAVAAATSPSASLGVIFGSSTLDFALFAADDLIPSCGAWSDYVRLRVPWDTNYLIRRHERMVIIAVGSLVANSIRVEYDAQQLHDFNIHSLVSCIATPLYAFLIKVFYFDLAQNHADDAGLHATVASRARGLWWSTLHLPLLGTILWFGVALAEVVNPSQDGEWNWGLAAAFASILLICTVQQMFHKGIGHGSRRVGKSLRMSIRVVFIVASSAVQPALAPLPRSGAALLHLAGGTALALAELWCRARKPAPRAAGRALSSRMFFASCAAKRAAPPPPMAAPLLGAELCVRDATDADAAALAPLLAELPAGGGGAWLRALGARGGCALVAEAAGAPLGLALCEPLAAACAAPRAMAHAVACAAHARRRGVGRRLVAALEARARAGGAAALVGCVPPHLKGAIDFHRAVGFRVVAAAAAEEEEQLDAAGAGLGLTVLIKAL